MLWNICRMETKIKTMDFSKSCTTWKNSCFGGFFHSTLNKKISIVSFFKTLCNAALYHSAFLDMYTFSRKIRLLQNMYDFIKNRIFAKECENTPSPCANFLKNIFSVLQCLEYVPSNFCIKTTRIQRERIFWKLFLFVKTTHVVLP